MSKKKEILVVSFISATMFAGLTAYVHVGTGARTAPGGAAPTGASKTAPTVQTDGRQQSVQSPVDQAPAQNTARQKKTRTRAS